MRDNPYYSQDFRMILSEYMTSTKNVRTAEEYAAAVNLICLWANKDFLSLNVEDAERYFAYLSADISDGQLTRKTVCFRLSACKKIANYIEETHPEYEYTSPFNYIRRPSVDAAVNVAGIPSMEELDKIMSAAKEMSKMDYLIFALATRMCLSASNILRIRKGSVEIKDGVPYLLVAAAETSTRWPRYIPVPEDVCELLSAYIESSHSDQAGHIFFNEHGRPLRQRNLDDRVRKIIKNSGVKGSYTLKDLRSRGILELFNTASDNDTIAEYVGLGKERMEAFSTAAQFISKECPPDLVNYRLKVG